MTLTLIKNDTGSRGTSLTGYTFIATSTDGRLSVFSHDYSNEIKVHSHTDGWLINNDADFTRFTVAEGTATHGTLVDLDTGLPCEIQWVGGDQ